MKISILKTTLLLCTSLLLVCGQISASTPDKKILPISQGKTILFLSDTQQPLWIEKIRLKEHNNEQATAMLFADILRESSAVALFHLGDFSAAGMFDSYWKPFDAFHRQLRIPIHPAFGNHDYYIFPPLAKENFRRRFLIDSPSWYVKTIENIAVIILNSNISFLSIDEQEAQQRWYVGQLTTLSADSSVHAIIVACHHPPFTNSMIVDPSEDVVHEFVVPFFECKKAIAFLSGHAHAYEHFRNQEKDFFVIGGGGGLLYPVLLGKERRYPDLFPQQTELRFFHYLRCELKASELFFSVRMLRNDFSGFDTVDTCTVTFRK